MRGKPSHSTPVKHIQSSPFHYGSLELKTGIHIFIFYSIRGDVDGMSTSKLSSALRVASQITLAYQTVEVKMEFLSTSLQFLAQNVTNRARDLRLQ